MRGRAGDAGPRQPGKNNEDTPACSTFYEERGTPIAVNLLLRVLCPRRDRGCADVSRGADREHPGDDSPDAARAGIRRFLGLSFAKLVCDAFMFFGRGAWCVASGMMRSTP